ncbi:MAG: hypothetical protein WCP81_02135 [Actinomycetes bacterium]
MSRTSNLRRVAAACLATALAAGLTGCGVGKDAGTNTQQASGSGTNVTYNGIELRQILLIAGPDGTASAVLIGTVVNTGPDDVIQSVTILNPPGSTPYIGGTSTVNGTIPLAKNSSTRIGFNSEDHVDFHNISVPATSYVDLEMRFANAGVIPVHVMVVPAIGNFAGIGPLPMPR